MLAAAADIIFTDAQFKKLAAVEEMPATNTVDVIGVVESVAPETQIVRRDGSEARKRSVVIKDDSQRSIEVEFAEHLHNKSVILLSLKRKQMGIDFWKRLVCRLLCGVLMQLFLGTD